MVRVTVRNLITELLNLNGSDVVLMPSPLIVHTKGGGLRAIDLVTIARAPVYVVDDDDDRAAGSFGHLLWLNSQNSELGKGPEETLELIKRYLDAQDGWGHGPGCGSESYVGRRSGYRSAIDNAERAIAASTLLGRAQSGRGNG